MMQFLFRDNCWLFALFLVFTIGQSSLGQYKPVVIGSDQGLSQAAVRSIAQDSEGFLWIATWDGLNRYDGHRFINFSHKPGDTSSLSSNNLVNVTFDGKDRPWVTAMNGEINLFEGRKNSFSLLRDKNGVPIHSLYNGFPFKFDDEHMIFLSPKGVVLTRISDLSSTILPEVKGSPPGLKKAALWQYFFKYLSPGC
ncbi:MAG: hypothetical protein IPJ75_11445 [Ignavibacteriales bacterium]|nr:hypothetical protein [Ignavibacteriales bacterium]